MAIRSAYVFGKSSSPLCPLFQPGLDNPSLCHHCQLHLHQHEQQLSVLVPTSDLSEDQKLEKQMQQQLLLEIQFPNESQHQQLLEEEAEEEKETEEEEWEEEEAEEEENWEEEEEEEEEDEEEEGEEEEKWEEEEEEEEMEEDEMEEEEDIEEEKWEEEEMDMENEEEEEGEEEEVDMENEEEEEEEWEEEDEMEEVEEDDEWEEEEDEIDEEEEDDEWEEEGEEEEEESTTPDQSPQPPNNVPRRGRGRPRGSSGGFNAVQTQAMIRYARDLGWSLQHHRRDSAVQSFCDEIGISRQQFGCWMRNNKSKYSDQ